MQVVPCAAPTGPIEPAPLTSLLLGGELADASLTAFWSTDDRYYVRAGERASGATQGLAECRWFTIADESFMLAAAEPAAMSESTDAERLMAARQFLDVIPMGGGRIAFPVGSTGRTIYRVWRSKAGTRGAGAPERGTGRTRILGVRAGRSLRRPA